MNERQSKTRTGENTTDVRKITPKMYATDEEDNPIKYYKLYQEKRPKSYCNADDPFYIAPRTIPLKNQNTDNWYIKQRIGIKKLGGLMKSMATKAGLDPNKRLTNHSARKHLVQKLRDNNVAPTDIMQITGHKNVQSVINYSTISDKKQIECSSIISNRKPVPSQPSASTSSSINPVVNVNTDSDEAQSDMMSMRGETTLATRTANKNNNELPHLSTVLSNQNVVGVPSTRPSSANSAPCPAIAVPSRSSTSGDLARFPTHSDSMSVGVPGVDSENQINLTETRQFQSMFFGATLNFNNLNIYCGQQS